MVPHAWLLFSATIWLPCSWFAPVLEFFGFPDPCRSNENPAFPPTPTIPPEPTNVVHTPTTVDTRHSALFALVVVVLLSLTCPLFFFARRLGVPLRLVAFRLVHTAKHCVVTFALSTGSVLLVLWRLVLFLAKAVACLPLIGLLAGPYYIVTGMEPSPPSTANNFHGYGPSGDDSSDHDPSSHYSSSDNSSGNETSALSQSPLVPAPDESLSVFLPQTLTEEPAASCLPQPEGASLTDYATSVREERPEELPQEDRVQDVQEESSTSSLVVEVSDVSAEDPASDVVQEFTISSLVVELSDISDDMEEEMTSSSSLDVEAADSSDSDISNASFSYMVRIPPLTTRATALIPEVAREDIVSAYVQASQEDSVVEGAQGEPSSASSSLVVEPSFEGVLHNSPPAIRVLSATDMSISPSLEPSKDFSFLSEVWTAAESKAFVFGAPVQEESRSEDSLENPDSSAGAPPATSDSHAEPEDPIAESVAPATGSGNAPSDPPPDLLSASLSLEFPKIGNQPSILGWSLPSTPVTDAHFYWDTPIPSPPSSPGRVPPAASVEENGSLPSSPFSSSSRRPCLPSNASLSQPDSLAYFVSRLELLAAAQRCETMMVDSSLDSPEVSSAELPEIEIEALGMDGSGEEGTVRTPPRSSNSTSVCPPRPTRQRVIGTDLPFYKARALLRLPDTDSPTRRDSSGSNKGVSRPAARLPDL